MAHYGSSRFHDSVLKDLRDWIWNNEKLRNKITQHELQYLFEFHPNRGLSIDLRRFEPDYYREVFYPPKEKKMFVDEFVRKVCVVISRSLKRSGKIDLSITITVRHMVSELSHWKTFYIDENFDGKLLRPMMEKETDWYYSYERTAGIKD